MNKSIDNRLNEIENSIKEQEHRALKILTNLMKYGFDDSNQKRKISVWKAFLSYLLRYGKFTIVLAFSTGIIAILSLVIAWRANNILEHQNRLFYDQNRRIEQQTYLQEAERRSSYVFLMSNIFQAMHEELSTDYMKNGVRDLSPELIGAISALSQGLKPYRLLEKDNLSELLSPERGQLLLILLRSNLSETTYTSIYNSSDFSYSDLRNFSLTRVNLKGAYLKLANFEGANLFRSDLSNADLSSASLKYATLVHAKIKGTNFFDTDLENAFVQENWFDDLNSINADYTATNSSYRMHEEPLLTYKKIAVTQIRKNYKINKEYDEVFQLGEEIFRRRKLIKIEK